MLHVVAECMEEGRDGSNHYLFIFRYYTKQCSRYMWLENVWRKGEMDRTTISSILDTTRNNVHTTCGWGKMYGGIARWIEPLSRHF